MPKTRILFTPEQDIWLYSNSRAKKWKSLAEFVDTFNNEFGLSKSVGSVTGHMRKHHMPHIDCLTTDANNAWTPEYRKWIEDNLDTGAFTNKKHFLKVFNAVFNENKTFDALVQYMQKNGLVLVTEYSKPSYTEEQEKWLRDNYHKYEVFADLVRDFNSIYDTDFKHANLTSKCKTLGLHTYDKNRYNAGQFKKGVKYGAEECPIGTIRYSKQSNLCYIKVKLCNGQTNREHGHNYKEPFWKMLQNKIWEDNYGAIPDGYMAVALTDDPYEQNIENITLIDKRGKAVMRRKDWWTDNKTFNSVGVQWCNLYFVAKDNGAIK